MAIYQAEIERLKTLHDEMVVQEGKFYVDMCNYLKQKILFWEYVILGYMKEEMFDKLLVDMETFILSSWKTFGLEKHQIRKQEYNVREELKLLSNIYLTMPKGKKTRRGGKKHKRGNTSL